MIPNRLKTFVQSVFTPRKYMESGFTPFYTNNLWGDSESRSGPGSNHARTAKLRVELPLLLQQIEARTLLDARRPRLVGIGAAKAAGAVYV